VLNANPAPAALFLSFGDAAPFAARIRARGIPLICQVQSIAQLPEAVDCGASIIVVQGIEAGGHGANSRVGRGTFTLVPEAADWLATHAPKTLLLAAGGIADGRGLAAALALGADGALIGSRLWATAESLAPPAAKAVAVETDGDGTARSSMFDILRGKDWPAPYDFRAVRNRLHRAWEDRIEALKADPEPARAAYAKAVAEGDYSGAHVTVGEATGLIRAVAPATDVLADITRTAAQILAGR
jgi:nitronate monooxygenase